MGAMPRRSDQGSDDVAELARLVPAPATPPLSPGRRVRLEEHLMQQITPQVRPQDAAPDPGPAGRGAPFTSRPRRWLAVTVPLTAAAAVIAAVAAAGVLGPRPGTAAGPPAVTSGAASGSGSASVSASGAASLLERISLVAAQAPVPTVRDDQFVYIESQDGYLSTTVSDSGTTSRIDPLHRRQIWLSVNGRRDGWLIEAATPDDVRNGIVLTAGTQPPSLGSPTYRYLETLPTDPAVLLRMIYKEAQGHGTGPDQEAFTIIGDMLRESIAPPALSAALYRAAARIPGVVRIDDSVDAAGRHGVGVAHEDPVNGTRDEWIFDRTTLGFLGERTVQTRDENGITAGTVIGRSAVLSRAIVDRVKQVP